MTKSPLKLLILSQVFTLFLIVFMPTLLRLLPGLLGKCLYTVEVIVVVGLAISLRKALSTLDDR